MQQWTARIRDCRTSGMTITAWCKENEINPKTYYYWQKKVRIAACEHLPAIQEEATPIVPLTNPAPSSVAEITPGSFVQTTAVLQMGRLRIELTNQISAELLDRIVQVIQHV